MEGLKVGGRNGLKTAFPVATVLLLSVLLLTACSEGDDSFGGAPPLNEPVLETTVLEPSNENQALTSQGDEHQDANSPGNIRNGERIYFTSTTLDGAQIPYRGGPDFGDMMMGNYLTCAACHGPTGQGGRHVMRMQTMDAPAITYDALQGESGEHAAEEGDETDEHAGEEGAYGMEDFRVAIVEGKHPDGDSLDESMPRWDMDEEELRDLLSFLKSITS